MKIAFFTNTDFFAWVLLRDRIRMLRGRGHEIVVITNVGGFRSKLETLDADLVHVPIARQIRPVSDLRVLASCVKHLRRQRPDVLNTYTSKSGFLGRVAGRLAGVPLVVHTMQGLPFYEGQPRHLYGTYAFLEWLAGRFGHALFSENEEDLVLARRFGLASPERLYYVGSGVMISRLDDTLSGVDPRRVRGEFDLPSDTKVILYPARLEPVKGHRFFLDVLDRLRSVSHVPFVCLCAGEGHLRSDLERRAGRLGLGPRVRFLGFRDAVSELLAVTDVMVLPSEKEGIPRSIMEAMAARRPVVAADVRGTREVVVSGETGFLSPWGNVEKMAGHLAQLLEDASLCTRLGDAGRARAEELFDDRRVVERMDALYHDLLDGRGEIRREVPRRSVIEP